MSLEKERRKGRRRRAEEKKKKREKTEEKKVAGAASDKSIRFKFLKGGQRPVYRERREEKCDTTRRGKASKYHEGP